MSDRAIPEDFLLPGETNLLAAMTRVSQYAFGTNALAVTDLTAKAVQRLTLNAAVEAYPSMVASAYAEATIDALLESDGA